MVALIGSFEKLRKAADMLLDAGIEMALRQYVDPSEAMDQIEGARAEIVILGTNIPEESRTWISNYFFHSQPQIDIIVFDPADPDQIPALIRELKQKTRTPT